MAGTKKHAFKAETQKVLSILTHSLYTNREIFLRELLSNASDALDKLRFLQSKGETVRAADLPLEIRITVDKDKGLLTIADTGLGMTEKEMVDNLGTIAHSGSEQFLKDNGAATPQESAGAESLSPDANGGADAADATESSGNDGTDNDGTEGAGKDSGASIIGRFGIGFYSVFMVAESVAVTSVSALADEPPHVWTSSGTGSFTVKTLDGEEGAVFTRGTVIEITLKDDARDFLENYRLQSAIRKHSNFLPFPIFMGEERINTTPALWREPKFSITKGQYADFYKYLTYDQKEPLDVLHHTVDVPVQYNSLLFIPDSTQDYFGEQRDQWGLDLYARRVLIERNNSELIPQYLAFLKGVVDTEDLPLNISRETLQENIVLRKISQTIVKQVFAHLEKLAANNKEKYEAFWALHGKYFKFACHDFAQRDRAAPLMRFSSSHTAEKGVAFTSLDEYISRMKTDQKEIWYITAPSPEAARVNPHMERFSRKGLEVLYLLETLDEFILESLAKYKDYSFKSVEQAEGKDLEAFADMEEAPATPALNNAEKASFDSLLENMRQLLGDKVKEIRVSTRLSGSPAVLVSPEGMSSSMEKLIRVMQKNDTIPAKVLEVNPDHPFMRALLHMYTADAANPLVGTFVDTLFDNLLLLDGYVKDPYLMADKNLKMLDRAASWYVGGKN